MWQFEFVCHVCDGEAVAYLVCARLQHVHHALLSHEGIRKFLLTQAIKENRQVVVEVQLLDFHLPGKAVCHTSMVDLDRQVAAFVKSK